MPQAWYLDSVRGGLYASRGPNPGPKSLAAGHAGPCQWAAEGPQLAAQGLPCTSAPRRPHRARSTHRIAPAPPRPPPQSLPPNQARVAVIEELIRKEHKIQRQHLESEVAAGRIAPYRPSPPPHRPTPLEAYGLPPHASAHKRDAAAATADATSRALWTSNPGYIARDGPRMASTAHTDFAWDAEGVGGARVVMGYRQRGRHK